VSDADDRSYTAARRVLERWVEIAEQTVVHVRHLAAPRGMALPYERERRPRRARAGCTLAQNIVERGLNEWVVLNEPRFISGPP
jgi:hypothetical protein